MDFVIEACNACTNLAIVFPTNHTEQEIIAAGFEELSSADTKCCCGAIDGLLIWLEKPCNDQRMIVQVGSGKFFCGRKKKFGLNMQGLCDTKKVF